MRKNLLLLLFFCVCIMAKAQDKPAITLTAETGSSVDLSLGFMVANENTKLSIDWGDGTKVETPVILVTSDEVNPTEVTGKPLGTGVIKIYGEGITKFDANCDYNYDAGASEPKLTELNVSNAVDLISLSVYSNSLSSLDLQYNTKLTKLTCYKNNLITLDLSKNLLLERLDCNNNKIASLNVSNCTKLTSLVCNVNEISSLDLTKFPELTNLNLMANKLSKLDFSKTPKLTYISVNNNNLTTLDVSVCTSLASLFCIGNQLSEIKVGKLTTTFNCSKNNLTFATIPAATGAKTFVYQPQNPMKMDVNYFVGEGINFSALDNLTGVTADKQITAFTWKTETGKLLVADTDYSVDKSVFKFLKSQDEKVYCEMTTPAFPNFKTTNIFKTAPFKVQADYTEPVITLTAGAVADGGTEGMTLNFNTAVEGMKLQIDWGNGTKVITAPGVLIDEYASSTAVDGVPSGNREIKIYGEGITSFDYGFDKNKPTKIVALDVTKATDLKRLLVTTSSLSTLDLSNNVALTNLDCSGNQFESIDLSANVNLEVVNFNGNVLTAIDLSKSPALNDLRINDNKVETLDLSNCTNLKNLYALNNLLTSVKLATQNEKAFINVNNNKLESLDLTKCGKITTLFCMGNLLTDIKVGQIATSFNCSGNKLTLATIPAETGVKTLTYAPQAAMEIPAEIDTDGTLDLSAQTGLKGLATEKKATTFTWKKADGTALVADTDYTEDEGVFKFLKTFDAVYCEMITDAFPKFTGANVFKTTNVKVNGGTSIDNSASDNVIVYTESGRLFIEGLEGSETINVYSLQGINVASTMANDAVVVLPLTAGQYIVMVNNVAHKAIVR